MNLLSTFIESKEKMPLLNYMQKAMTLPAFTDFSQVARKKRLMTIVKRQPEVLGIVRGVASDITGYSHFEPINQRSSGRTTVNSAQEFAQKICWQKLKRNIIMDALITGEGYLWKGQLSQKQLKELRSEITRLETKSKAKFDEDLTAPRFLRQVASSTMSIRNDGYDITSYAQKVGGNETIFRPDELIRLSFEEIDGKVEGMTPLYALPLHIELLWLLWQNQYFLQAKGNHPDILLTVDGIDMNHPSYQKVLNELQAYNKPGNPSHGTLLLAGGKYSTTVLDRVDTLQFKEVCQYVTSIIASMWQYPQNRIGVKTAEASKDKDSGGNSEKGYWANIEIMQDLLALIMNSQLWEPYFGVKEVYDKSYLHDEVVEGTSEQLRLGNLQLKQNVLSSMGKRLKQQACLNCMNNRAYEITEEDIEEMPMEMMMPQMSGTGSAPKQMGQNSMQSQKRDEEFVRERNTGKPTGV